MIKDKCREYLYYFNYTDDPEGEIDDLSSTAYFSYDGDTQHDKAKFDELHDGYLKNNTRVLGRDTVGD